MPELKPIHCLIVDDEPPARDILRRYISAIPHLTLYGECGNAIEAMNLLQQQSIDLVFLDICLPQLKGNELLKILKNPPKVIFTTAHAEYALEGYELDIVDYLLKPIQFDRFVKSVNKAFQLTRQPTGLDTQHTKEDVGNDPFVYFRADRKMVKVLLKDILYIESMKDYVKVFTRNGVIITKQSITSVEAMLPEHQFVRTHRSFIASVDKIRAYSHELIEIEKNEIPIGKLFKNHVFRVLGEP